MMSALMPLVILTTNSLYSIKSILTNTLNVVILITHMIFKLSMMFPMASMAHIYTLMKMVLFTGNLSPGFTMSDILF